MAYPKPVPPLDEDAFEQVWEAIQQDSEVPDEQRERIERYREEIRSD